MHLKILCNNETAEIMSKPMNLSVKNEKKLPQTMKRTTITIQTFYWALHYKDTVLVRFSKNKNYNHYIQ
jgi:hypothetical protein